jgi:hypothetical protein
MTDDQLKTFKRDFIERLNKVKGLLQQSVPEIRELIKTSDVVETARKLIDPKNIEKISEGLKKIADATLPQAIIKQAVIDFQLNDIVAKAEELVAKANLTLTKIFSKDTLPTETLPNEKPTKKVRLKKAPSKKTRLKKTVSKKTPSKKKTKRSSKRKV